MTERERLVAIVDEVAEKVGYTGSIPVRSISYPPFFSRVPHMPMIATDTLNRGIAFIPGTLDEINDFQMAGAVAHEIGHLLQPPAPEEEPPEQAARNNLAMLLGRMPVFDDLTENEFGADAYATKHGYGPHLLNLFEWMAERFAIDLTRRMSSVHPPLGERIRRIEAIMNEKA